VSAGVRLRRPAAGGVRLFNFTRGDGHLAYLRVLRALERLRAVHHVQAHPEDVAHHDLCRDKVARTTSALLLLWDGRHLIDVTAGFKDNGALVTELLGFRPARHTPPGTDAALYVPALSPDPVNPEDDED
jgi:hypothetical protein